MSAKNSINLSTMKIDLLTFHAEELYKVTKKDPSNFTLINSHLEAFEKQLMIRMKDKIAKLKIKA